MVLLLLMWMLPVVLPLLNWMLPVVVLPLLV